MQERRLWSVSDSRRILGLVLAGTSSGPVAAQDAPFDSVRLPVGFCTRFGLPHRPQWGDPAPHRSGHSGRAWYRPEPGVRRMCELPFGALGATMPDPSERAVVI